MMCDLDFLTTIWLIRILGHEGGYVYDKNDPGGETRWGISKRSYPYIDIRNLKVDEAAEIYKRDFLKPLKADQYSDGVVYQMFDFAVNSGPDRAVKELQKVLGIEDDGVIGPITIGRINALSESDLIMLIVAARLEFMTGLRNWANHGRGWARRIAANLRYGAEDSD